MSSVDRNLPKVTLEFFLQQETGGAPTRWEVTDCGEQTGNPEADRGRDFPMCVEAEVSLKHRRTLTVEVLIGTASKGPFGQSAMTSVTISEWDGRSKALRLSDIPTELQRPRMPEKQDLPPVVGM